MLRIGGRVGRGATEVDMRVCSDEQVAEALDVDAAIRSQRLAFEWLGRERCNWPRRSRCAPVTTPPCAT
ncbi:hypothetical protein ACFQ0O_19000 [Saccharopolyspora spinosporotrichia]